MRLTIDEVIETLKRSSDPALLAEGVDDVAVLRRLEDEFEDAGLSFFPLGGRDAVLTVFERRNEIGSKKPVLFLADKDVWVFTGIPHEYQSPELLFTDGYSLENDLYRDGRLERLLTRRERTLFERDLSEFIEWFALALRRHLTDSAEPLSLHPSNVLDDRLRYVEFVTLREGEERPEQQIDELKQSYRKCLRGKSLMGLLTRHLSSRGREAKHSVRSLMEHGCVAEGNYFARIVDWLKPRLRY